MTVNLTALAYCWLWLKAIKDQVTTATKSNLTC